MNIILKNGASYPVVRTNKNILTVDDTNRKIYKVPEEINSICTIDIVLKTDETEISDLFKIEEDFSEDNINDVTYKTENGSEIKDSYDALNKINQNISDFVNETNITLIKYR